MCAWLFPSSRSATSRLPTANEAATPGRILPSVALLGAAVIGVYFNSLTAPFIFDDHPGILNNASIRKLGDLGAVLSPPPEVAGAGGRPIVNLSLALNHALGGFDVRGYHALNLALHFASALALLGVVRRTLLQPAVTARFAVAATPFATAVALLWAVHPLLTESVTCIIQRSEIMGSLFYLLILYCFVRWLAPGASRVWPVLSVVCCLLGVAAKEFVVSAPLLAWLYDRTFVAGSFRTAWQQHRRLYLALASTWIVLGALILGASGRGGTVGFGLGITAWDYALTQCRALFLYIRLSFWPHPLVLDYGHPVESHIASVLPQALLMVALLGGTLFALRRRSFLGFPGALFFAVLAPSSSFIPLITQTVAEHRMYLPLAAVIVFAVTGLHALFGRRTMVIAAVLALGLGALTIRRNHDYRTAESIWRETVAARPDNPRAHYHLGRAYALADRTNEAIAAYQAALRLHPEMADALVNLGEVLVAHDRAHEALPHLQLATRVLPTSAEAHVTLGAALDKLGRTDDALLEYRQALNLRPQLAIAHRNLADALVRNRDVPAALLHFQEAVRLEPAAAHTRYQLAGALALLGRLSEARTEFARGFQLDPVNAPGLLAWANALTSAGLPGEAVDYYVASLRLQPDSADARYNYGNTLAALKRFPEAAQQYADAVRLNPNHSAAHTNLGNTFLLLDRDTDALPHYERAVALTPNSATAHDNLGLALARLGRLREAAARFEAAVRLAPENSAAREHLAQIRVQLGETP